MPTEILSYICSLLDVHSQVALSHSCRVLHAAAEGVLGRDPNVVLRRIVGHAKTLCAALPPLHRPDTLKEVSTALEVEARLSFARLELIRRCTPKNRSIADHVRTQSVQSGEAFHLVRHLTEVKEFERLGRTVELQLAYLCTEHADSYQHSLLRFRPHASW